MSANRKTAATLWTVQVLLALLFLMAGGFKLATPIETLAAQSASSGLSGEFVKFIGVCEFLGALGLVLPGLTRIKTWLTPLAAAGLVIIMIGATIVTLIVGPAATAAIPFVTGLLATFVAYGRWRVVPLRRTFRATTLQPAR